MIEEFAKKLASMQGKKPWLFVAGFVFVTLVLLPGVFLVFSNVEPSIEKVLPSDVHEVVLMNDMRSQFGADMVYVLFSVAEGVQDVRDPFVVRYLSIVGEKISSREHVISVSSLADLGDPRTLTEAQWLFDSEEAAHFMNPDYSMTVMMVQTDTGASAEVINLVVEAIEEDIKSSEAENPGLAYSLTGFGVIDRATFNIIISDFSRITLLSFALVALVVFLTFRRVMRTVLPLAVVMVALVWMMGLAGYLGLTITVVSMVAAAMIMGLGIDFGIHIMHAYVGYRRQMNKQKALQSTMQELLRASLAASLTTSAGFLALLFGVMVAMQTLGILLAIGIMSTLFGAIGLLPALIALAEE